VLLRAGRSTQIRVTPGAIERGHLKSAAFYSLGISGLSLQNDGDKTVLPKYHGADAGLYAAAYRIVQFGLVPISSLLSSSLTTFMDHDEQAEGQHVRRTFRFTLVAAAYSVLFGLLIYVLAPTITESRFFEDYRDATSIIRWLAPFILARAVVMFAINGLLGLGRTGERTAILVGGGILSLGLYLALIPTYSWKGAIAGTLVSETVVGATAWVLLLYYQRKHDIGVRQANQLILAARAGDPTMAAKSMPSDVNS
jgi:O-antigen/teichoic acid export membrane protein